MRTSYTHLALALVCLTVGSAHAAADKCRQGASALSDAKAIAGVRGAIAQACPCATFDASTPDNKRGAFVRCAKAVIKDATDGTALAGGYALRKSVQGGGHADLHPSGVRLRARRAGDVLRGQRG